MKTLDRCRAKIMSREIHDYRGSAHAHVMRMIAFGSYIRNSTITTLNWTFSNDTHFFAKSVQKQYKL